MPRIVFRQDCADGFPVDGIHCFNEEFLCSLISEGLLQFRIEKRGVRIILLE